MNCIHLLRFLIKIRHILDKKVCYVCDTEEQIKEIALTEGHFEITRCPHCYQK